MCAVKDRRHTIRGPEKLPLVPIYNCISQRTWGHGMVYRRAATSVECPYSQTCRPAPRWAGWRTSSTSSPPGNNLSWAQSHFQTQLLSCES